MAQGFRPCAIFVGEEAESRTHVPLGLKPDSSSASLSQAGSGAPPKIEAEMVLATPRSLTSFGMTSRGSG